MNELKDYQSILSEHGARAEKIFERHPEASKDFKRHFDEITNEKIRKVEPTIMVYGIYNAGKSSIINELIGEDSAPVEDIPKTSKIDRYPWRGYVLFDTPGILAPIEHENVTEEHIKKADIVLFVMSTTGSSEKLENYARMKTIADSGKKIIIILNDKNGDLGVNDAAIEEIRRKVGENMTKLHIDNVDEKYCIITVNAARARRGRLKNKPGLIQKSGMPELSTVIRNELKNTKTFYLLCNGIRLLEEELEQFADVIERQNDSESADKINRALRALNRQKNLMRRDINTLIDSQTQNLSQTLPKLIWTNRTKTDQIDGIVSREINRITRRVYDEFQSQCEDLRELNTDVEQEIKNFAAEKATLNAVDAGEFKNILARLDGGTAPTRSGSTSTDMIPLVMQNMLDGGAMKNIDNVANVGTVGLTAGLVTEGTKELAKSFVKTEIGKTIAKSAIGKVVGSVIPIVGPVMTAISLLKMFGGGDNGKQLDAQIAQQNAQARQQADAQMKAEMQARQEIEQRCYYMAGDLADKLKDSLKDSIDEAIGMYEAPYKAVIAERRNDNERLSDDVAQLRALIDEYKALRVELGAR